MTTGGDAWGVHKPKEFIYLPQLRRMVSKKLFLESLPLYSLPTLPA
jgi:hypothetical protein